MTTQVLLAKKVPLPPSSFRYPQPGPAITGVGGLSLEAAPGSRQESARLVRLRRECEVSAGPFLVLAAACAVLVLKLALIP